MKSSKLLAACALALLVSSSIARADTFAIDYESAGVENSTAQFSVEGVDTFNNLAKGYDKSLTTDFGTNGAITGVYAPASGNWNGVQINSADQYGGAGGKGNYIVAFPSTPYQLTLTANAAKDPQGINYFGYWLSALDPGNIVTFSNNGVVVGQVTPGELKSSLGKAYYGNPNSKFAGQDGGEPFAFVNFYDTTGTFNKVTFSEGNNFGGGYESDNHTVGFYTQVSAVPEPATWAMMLLGFAGLSFAAYRRKTLAFAV